MITKMESRLTIVVIIGFSISFWLSITLIVNIFQECSQYKPILIEPGMRNARIAPFPYHFMAALVLKKHGRQSNDELLCDGAIINRYWLVTSALCASILKQSKPYVRIRANSHNWKTGIEHRIERYLVHEKYGQNETDYNIALIRVVEPLIGARVSFVDIPDFDYYYFSNSTAEIIGWSLTMGPPLIKSPNFKKLKVLVLEENFCSKKYAIPGKNRICAGNYSESDELCRYKHGAALMQNRMLVGIASLNARCDEDGFVGVFLKMAYFQSNIQDILNNGDSSEFISNVI